MVTTDDRSDGPVVVVAGPTASGKSALALDIAQSFTGTVINADSMQVYRDLRILTARPSPEEEAMAPHRLYGVLDGGEACSAGRWAAMAATEIRSCRAEGRLPIVCGGTGLYIRALTQGLSPIPEVPAAYREAARALVSEIGNEAFQKRLRERDPATAARLHVGDTQRLTRAWEVLEATGRSITEWQAEPDVPVISARFHVILLAPPRDVLASRCDIRFDLMIEQGALDEVAALEARGYPDDAPVMKSLGVPELRAALHGELSVHEAVARGKQATRSYAKRQLTWFRGQLRADMVMDAQYSESLRGEIFPFLRRFLLTLSE